MTTVTKCIKQHIERPTKQQMDEFKLILHRYNKVRNYVFHLYANVNGLQYLKYPRTIRDEWVKSGFADQWKLPPKYWKMAFEDAFNAIKSNWEASNKKVRQAIHRNSQLNENEKIYCFYVLKADSLLYALLTDHLFQKPPKLEKLLIDEKKVHSYLKRQVEKFKFGKPNAINGRSINIDVNMYNYRNKKYDISIQGLVKGQQIRLNTSYSKIFSGNLKLVLKENHIEIHKSIQSKTSRISDEEKVIGLDKGYCTLMATSEHVSYGDGFNDLLTQESDFLRAKNGERNKARSHLKTLLDNGNLEEGEKIKKFNLGRKKYNVHFDESKARIESFVNSELNRFFKEQKPSTIVVENLDFNNNWNKHFPKRINRLLSSWIKGYIQERLEYKASVFNVEIASVNPAYTSQICFQCRKFGVRKGNRFQCEEHGTVDADDNASVNILHRLYDREITLYTPYKLVKQILLSRLITDVRKAEVLALPLTEPSKTLDTDYVSRERIA